MDTSHLTHTERTALAERATNPELTDEQRQASAWRLALSLTDIITRDAITFTPPDLPARQERIQDLVQDGLIAAYQTALRIRDPRAAFKAMRTRARGEMMEQLRKGRYDGNTEDRLDTVDDDGHVMPRHDVEAAAANRNTGSAWDASIAWQAAETLPDPDRSALLSDLTAGTDTSTSLPRRRALTRLRHPSRSGHLHTRVHT